MLYGLSAKGYQLYRSATDMRKGFDGLSGLVRNELGRDPLSGEAFIFVNRRRTLLKLLVWEQSGFAIYYKRLEKGTFELPYISVEPNGEATKTLRLTREKLLCILEGIELGSVRHRERFSLPEPADKSA